MKEQRHYLETVSWGIIPIINYNGKNVTKIIGGYVCLNQKCKNGNEVDEVIKKAENNLNKSIWLHKQPQQPENEPQY